MKTKRQKMGTPEFLRSPRYAFSTGLLRGMASATEVFGGARVVYPHASYAEAFRYDVERIRDDVRKARQELERETEQTVTQK
jgi:hypothetical protein